MSEPGASQRLARQTAPSSAKREKRALIHACLLAQIDKGDATDHNGFCVGENRMF